MARVPFFTLALAALLPHAAVACTCSGPANALGARATPMLFEGRVVRIAERPLPRPSSWDDYLAPVEVEFEVARYWRGDVPASLILTTGYGGGDCGYPFELGVSYVVPAHIGSEGLPATGLCSGVETVWQARPSLEVLGEGIRPVPAVLRDHMRSYRASRWGMLWADYTALAVAVILTLCVVLYTHDRLRDQP